MKLLYKKSWFSLFFISFCIFASSLVWGQTLVPAGATWKYLDNGSDQGTSWQQIAFDDSTWSSGLAQLGYEDGDEATLVGYGSDSQNK